MIATFTWGPSGGPSAPGAAELVVGGEVDLAACRQTAAVLDQAAARPRGPVRVDLSRVTFLDVAGLSVLLVLLVRLHASGRPAALHRPSPPVLRLLVLTGTAEVLPLAPVQDDGGAPPSAEHLAVERSRLFRDLEHHLHDGTTWRDPCAGPASSRDTATGAHR